MVISPLGVFVFRDKVSSLMLLIIISLGVYPLLSAGWRSNRNYAFLGRVRGVAQTISYEIRLALIFIIFMVFWLELSLIYIRMKSLLLRTLVLRPAIFMFWLVSGLAETNRTPFDFAEGESELVSGFNVEYGAGGFALLFIAEYGRILFFSYLTTMVFLGGRRGAGKAGALTSAVFFFWVWARATLPRYRYDLLMRLAWKRILPIVLGVLEFEAALGYWLV